MLSRNGAKVFLLASLLALGLAACVGSAQELTLEERAQQIDKSLICPVCPAETIDQSQATLAKQMRQLVREKLAQGQSDTEILQFFVDRYGQSVLAAPPRSGFNLVAWVVPPVGILLGIVALLLVVRAMSQRTREGGGEEALPPEAELAPYLPLVDQELEEQRPEGQPEPEPPGERGD
ncbi:MAG: cytochrome c-type biogenesis protein CcmH [Dehalococcoidia bacterium]